MQKFRARVTSFIDASSIDASLVDASFTAASFIVSAFCVAFLISPFSTAHAAPSEGGRNQLAHIVDTQCLPNFHHKHSPFPCNHVNPSQDYVIMQDARGSGHYLLIAISPVAGIESASLLADEAPRYFQNAWQHRSIVAATRGSPIDDRHLGILINSVALRTQDRLHLHIAPLHRPFANLLAQHAANITRAGTTLTLEGRTYHVRKISEHALAQGNPFAMISQRPFKAAQDLSRTVVILAGAGKNAQGENELYLIEHYCPERPTDGWFPEDLLDWRSMPVAIGHDQSAGT